MAFRINYFKQYRYVSHSGPSFLKELTRISDFWKGLVNVRRPAINNRFPKLLKQLSNQRYLWLLALPGIAYFIIFYYIPMYGATIAFKDFSMRDGILGSPWIGFKYFIQFFESPYFFRLLKNTLLISFYSIIFGFPVPIILALLINECTSNIYKKVIQTLTYLPYFISLMVIVAIMINFVNPVDGIVNVVLKSFGKDAINFMTESSWFRPLYVISNIWQFAGWSSIIYMASLSSIDVQLYESAMIDGAKRIQLLRYITIPSIVPIIMIMLILRMGQLMSVGFEKIILMYNPGVYETADVISTYVYRVGLLGLQFSFGAAVGLFNSVINLILLVSFNTLSKKVSETSIW